ncbi:unnamed protein product [Didymodactylos carnosus]|uniref:Uncharacterized protein n=1 Tax=Didymodactylos carnosus TaxID=1234261 RepID=A0A815CVL1_9BILA|nr:unnamed protein product [Didymodactylos carnosus]CAF1290264.1 unnamed protein product [Didymodactylos carnosus]CAF3868562.1 unnamed protein product [Didymodactylos carnosus]CAF4095634.1 unnamed protein product [Didymodactylos carnosus]
MDAGLEFCLKRFADEQLTETIKHVAELERNVLRQHTKIKEKKQDDDVLINHLAINKTRQIIEDGFRKALDNIKADIDIIAQISSTRSNNQQNNEDIRTASNKIRQQIACIDSELTHLFNMIDYNTPIDYSSRIIPWFRQHYGYANELNRLVGKSTNVSDTSGFSETSSLMQCIMKRVRLWDSRQKLIIRFTHQMNEDSSTGKHLIDSLYRMTDTSSALQFIQNYVKRRQKENFFREVQLLHHIQLEVEQRRLEQQALATELVSALCQFSINLANDFQLNKKLRKVFQQSEMSKQFVPMLID